MGTVKDGIVPPLHLARTIIDNLGFRLFSVDVITRTWSGPHVGEGTATDATLRLAPNFKVRVVTNRYTATDAGTVRDGDLLVSPITPATAVVYGAMAHVGTGTGTVTPSQNVLTTGVTQGPWSLVVTITTDGTTFRYSVDGGAHDNGADLAIGAPFQVPGIGILLAFAGSFVAGDTYSVKGTSVGYTVEQLDPRPAADNVQVIYRLTDGYRHTDDCNIVRLDDDRATKLSLYLRVTRSAF